MSVVPILMGKIIFLMTILVPPYSLKNKHILLGILMLRYVLDICEHSEGFKKLIGYEDDAVGALIVRSIQLLLAVVFLIAAIILKAWIPLVPGAFSVMVLFFDIKDQIEYLKK